MSFLNLLDHAFALRLTVTLLHFLWQGTLVALVAAPASHALRRTSAQSRYLLNVTALLLMAMCVPLTFARVSVSVFTAGQLPADPQGPASLHAGVSEAEARSPGGAEWGTGLELPRADVAASRVPDGLPAPTSGTFIAQASAEVEQPIPRTGQAETPESASRLLLRRCAPYVTLAYFAGVLLLSVRLLRGAAGSRRLGRAATAIKESELLQRVHAEARRFRLSAAPAVKWCADVSVPAVMGVVRPVILLPASAATGLSLEQLQAVIAHELAHIRRHDLAINLLQRVIEALLFFHPAVWWISRHVSRERERACDQLVLSAGYERARYADALLRMAELSWTQRRRPIRASAHALAADGASPTEFKRRILHVLDVSQTPHLRPSRIASLVVLVAMLAAVAGPAAWLHFQVPALAQTQPEEEKADKTLTYFQSLQLDSKITEPEATGRKLAEADIAAGRMRILYCGKPWSAGKPLIDDETGYRVEIMAGCTVSRNFVLLLDAYNSTMREHFAETNADLPPSEVLTDRVIARLSNQHLPFLNDDQIGALRAEFRDYLSERVSPEISIDLRTSILVAIDAYVLREFNDASCYLGFRGKVDMLKWRIWTASERQELNPDELTRRTTQRDWMRDYIRALPAASTGDRVAEWTHAGRLKLLNEQVFTDVLSPFLYDPMTEDDFQRFQKVLHDRTYNRQSVRSRRSDEPEDAGTVIDAAPIHNALVHAPAFIFYAAVVARLDSLKMRFPPGFPTGGLSTGGTTDFGFAEAPDDSLTGCFIGRHDNNWTLYDADRKIPVVFTGTAEEFNRAEKPGDLWYDTETGVLHTARGAKLTAIQQTEWYLVDRIPLSELQQIVERDGRDVWSLKEVRNLHPFFAANNQPVAAPSGVAPGEAVNTSVTNPHTRFEQALKALPTFVLRSGDGTIIPFRVSQLDPVSLYLQLRSRPLPPNLPLHPGDVEHPDYLQAYAAAAAEESEATLHTVQHQDEAASGTLNRTTRGNSIKLLFSPDGRRLAVMNGNPTRTMFQDGRSVAKDWRPTVDVIDTETENVTASLDLSDLPLDPNRPVEEGPTFIEATAIAFSPDGATLAVGTSLGQLLMFNAATGTLLRSLDDQPGRLADENVPDLWKQIPRVMGGVKSIAFSPDGRLIAVCGESFADWRETLSRVERLGLRGTAPGRLKVFDVETGTLKFNPTAHSDMAVDVAYSPDGRYLASAGRWMDSLENHQFGDGLILWDAETGQRKAQVDLQLRGWMYDAKFSPDSKRILVGAQDFDEGGGNGTGVAAMLSTDTLAVLWRRPITRSAMAVAFYPQEAAVIVLTNREKLSFIEADTGKTLMALRAPDSDPQKKELCEDFAISPQGHVLAMGIVEKGRGHVHFLRMGKLDADSEEESTSVESPIGEFSAPTEVVLSMGTLKFMLDLDSGSTIPPPAGLLGEEAAKFDVHPNQHQPYDLPSGLVCRGGMFLAGAGLKGMRVRPDQWNASAATVGAALASDRVQALAELPYDPSESATYFFTTAAGTHGVLQLLERLRVQEAVSEPWGIRLCYKTLGNAARLTPPAADVGDSANPLDNLVSLHAQNQPLRNVVEQLARQVGLTAEFDSDALRNAEVDLDMPITATFQGLALNRAMARVLDWQRYPGLMHEVRGNRLVLTTLAAWQARTAQQLPEWMKPLYNHGLLATVDEHGHVHTVTIGNIMTDELMSQIATLPDLRALDFQLTEGLTPQGLAHLGQMSRLERLCVSRDSDAPLLGDEVIRYSGSLGSLRELTIIECGVTDAGARLLEPMTRLRSLSLSQEGRLTDESLKSIGTLTELTSLSLNSYVGTEQLGWMRFSASGIRELRGLKNLQSLHLVGQEVPADVLDFPELTSLSLGHAAVDDSVAVQISKLGALRSLELVYCHIGDAGLEAIASLADLRRLDLSSNSVSDAGIEHFAGHPHLEHISLRAEGVTDRSLEHIVRIPSLTHLDLYGSGRPGVSLGQNFSPRGLAHLKQLSNLETLWLANFQMEGGYAVLEDLQQLRELTMMMCDITDQELEALEKALPNTRISHTTGGGRVIRRSALWHAAIVARRSAALRNAI